MKPRNPSRISTTLITICLGMSVASTSNAAYLTWTGGASDGDLFATPGNWSDDATSLPPASVLAADRLTIGNGDTVSRTANITVNRVTVSGGATLNVTAGSQVDNAGGVAGSRNLIGNGSTGVVNLSGATTSYNIGQMLSIAHSTNSNGTFNQTGGTLNISRSQSSQIGNWGGTTFPGHTTTSFNASHSLQIGGPSGSTNISGLYEISGGSLLTRAGVGIGMNGTFSLVGSGVTAITLGGSNTDTPGWWAQSSAGTLKVAVDAGGITKISIRDKTTGTNTRTPFVEFQAGAILDLDFVGAPVSGTWTVMELEGQDILDGGLTLAPGDAESGWSFAIDNTGPNGLLTVTRAASLQLIWNGNINGNWDLGTTANWQGAATYSQPADVTFDDTLTGTSTVNLTTTLSPQLLVVNNPTANYTFSGPGKITGFTGLTKDGAGPLTISNTGGNDFTGPVLLKAGTLTLGVASALGNTGGLLNLIDGTLDLGGFSVTKGAVDMQGGTLSNGTLTGTSFAAQAGTVNAVLAGASATLTKTTNGTLTLNGSNTYGGATTLGAGTLTLGVVTAMGDIGGLLNVNGGTLDLGGFSVTKGAVNIKGGTISNGTLTGTSFATEAGTINAALAGAGATLTKTGAGILTLNGTNTYDGETTLTSGTLNVNTTTALGAAASAINLNGGTIDNTSGSAITLANDKEIVLGGNFAYSTAAGTAANNLHLGNGAVSIAADRTITLNGTGALTFGGVLTNTLPDSWITLTVNNGTGTSSASVVSFGGFAVTGTGGTEARINIAGSGKVNLTGPVTDGVTAGTGLDYTGTGVLTLSGTNTYTGTTTASGVGGVLSTPTAAALVGYGTGNVIFNGGAIGVQVGAGGWTTSEVDHLLATATKFGGALGIDTTIGDLTQWTNFTTTGFGQLGLIKLGANALTLDQTNTYTGPTTLREGKLNINSAIALGTADSIINLNGGTIDNTSGSAITLVNNQEIVLGGNFAYSTSSGAAANNLHLGNGAVSIAANRTITLNGTGELTFGGVLANTANSVRTLTVNNGAGTSSASVVNLGGYALTGSGSTAARINVINGSGNVNITGAVTDGESPLSGLTYSGTGILTLSAANTYTGQTAITSGMVKLSDAQALGDTSSVSHSISTTANSTAATVVANTPIAVGMQVTGSGIRAGTRVTAYTAGTGAVTLNQTATATALVSADFVSTTSLDANGALDLNGLTINKAFANADGTFINSNTTTAAAITTEMVQVNNPKFDGPGDIVVNTIRTGTSTTARRITKSGTGTLTLEGAASNGRHGLTVNDGNVILAKTAGEAVDRYALIMNGGTVTLQGKSDQITNSTDQLNQINGGTLDLNGFNEQISQIGTSTGTETGGTITNSDLTTTSTFTLSGGTVGETTLFSFPGSISGNLNLVKGGTNTQVLTGILSYTGDTTINGGTLELGASSALADSSAVRINGTTSILKLAEAVTDMVNELWIDGVQVEKGTYGATGSGAKFIDNVHFAGAGVLEVATGDPVLTDYDDWATLYAPADLSNMAGDNDNDGIANFEEYAFGLNPVSGTSVSPILTQLNKSTGIFTYQRRAATGLTYKIQTSTDLVAWPEDTTATAGQVAGPVDENGNHTVTVTLTGAPLTEPKFFVRVTAE